MGEKTLKLKLECCEEEKARVGQKTLDSKNSGEEEEDATEVKILLRLLDLQSYTTFKQTRLNLVYFDKRNLGEPQSN